MAIFVEGILLYQHLGQRWNAFKEAQIFLIHIITFYQIASDKTVLKD